MEATQRVYRTVEGELVREGDPRGAYLAYSPGQTIEDRDLDAYQALMDAHEGAPSPAQEARDALAQREARANPAPAAFVGHQAATEAANEQRELANRAQNGDDAALDELGARAQAAGQGTVAKARVFRAEDGRLVREGDPAAATLAYAPGQVVPAGQAAEYRELVGQDEDDQAEGVREAEMPATPTGDKADEDSETDKADKAAATTATTGPAKSTAPAKATSTTKGPAK